MDGERIVYTGDTGDARPIMEFARGSDLLIVEATFPEPSPDSRGVHLTLDEAMELSAVSKEYMLVHFTSGSYRKALGEGFVETR